MSQRQRSTGPNWTACKQAIRNWPRPGLIALLQELYRLSDDNRRFLHGRLLPQHAPQTMDDARRKIGRMVSALSVFSDRFQPGEVKRIIDQFAKATDDPAAVAELLLFDLDASFATFSQVGDFEPMVDHLYATLARLDKCLHLVPPDALPPLVKRLGQLAADWGDKFGWGISDELTAVAEEWREKVG